MIGSLAGNQLALIETLREPIRVEVDPVDGRTVSRAFSIDHRAHGRNDRDAQRAWTDHPSGRTEYWRRRGRGVPRLRPDERFNHASPADAWTCHNPQLLDRHLGT
jgi:hypothetical protein